MFDPTAFTRPIKNWLARKGDAALAGFTGSAQALGRHSVRLVADELYRKWQWYLGIMNQEATMDSLEQFYGDQLKPDPAVLEIFQGVSRDRMETIMTRDEQDQVMVWLARMMLQTGQATVVAPPPRERPQYQAAPLPIPVWVEPARAEPTPSRVEAPTYQAPIAALEPSRDSTPRRDIGFITHHREVVRGSGGQRIGELEIYTDGRQTLYDSYGPRGKYDPNTNSTYNSKGQVVGKGNVVMMLLGRPRSSPFEA